VPHFRGHRGYLWCGTSLEDGRGAGDPGADPRLEVASDVGGDSRRTPICLEALEIEAEALGSLPEVRVVDTAPVGVEGVDHLEEAALGPGGLCGRVQGW
jgi:hypothetical protein